MIRPKTILIVEDDPDIVEFLEIQGKMRGFRTIRATSSKEGLSYMRKYRPDLVLLDLRLPKEHGFFFTSQLRKNPLFKKTPIVVFSAQDDEATIQAAFELGVDEFVSKPSPPSELFRQVRACL